jgi:hypothetical protein
MLALYSEMEELPEAINLAMSFFLLRRTRRKTLEARERTNNKLDSHLAMARESN